MTATVNDAWMETALISISAIGGTELSAQGQTETIDIDIGDKDVEGVPILNGGRVTKWTPQADSTFTFEAYPVEVGTATGSVLKGWEDLMDVVDTSQPLRVQNSHTRNKYRVVVEWTNDPAATSAVAQPAAGYEALRAGGADGYFTSVKKSFTDGILKYTCIFKVPAFDKNGSACLLSESTDGSVQLPAIASYTTSYKFG